jgi:predicted DCC family thiol-disulfide oxidoreductase YuxK
VTAPNPKSILIYDGECPVCQRARQWIERHVSADVLQTMPCQDLRREELVPSIPYEDCMQAMQLITPDGRVHAAERAFPHVLRLTRYGRFIGWLFYLPGAGVLYRLFARNRLAISGLLERKSDGEQCSIDRDCR